MAKLAVILIVALAFHCIAAAPRPENVPAEPTQETGNVVVKLLKDISAEIEKRTDPKHIAENVEGTGKQLAANLEGILAKFKVEADKNKATITAANEAILTRVTDTIDALNKLAAPAEGSKAAEYKAKFDNSIKELQVQGEKLKDNFKPVFEKAQEDITAFGKYLYDGFWTATKTVSSHVTGTAQ